MSRKARAAWVWRVSWGAVALLSLLLLVVLPLGISYLIVYSRFVYPDSDAGLTPADFGLQYETVRFESDPGLMISGWLIPARLDFKSQGDPARQAEARSSTHQSSCCSGNRPGWMSKGSVVLSHGLNRTRAEVLRRGIFLAKSGYDALLIDLRHHGRSGGERSSLGFYESNDIVAAVDFLRREKRRCNNLVLWGVSMGASASLLAGSRIAEVSALIVDSSFLSFEETISHHGQMILGLPQFPIVDAIIQITSLWLGFRPSDFDLRRTVVQFGDRPILLIAGGNDPRMPPRIARTLFRDSPSRSKELLIVQGAGHGAAYRTDPRTYQQTVLAFLEKHLGRKRSTPATDSLKEL